MPGGHNQDELQKTLIELNCTTGFSQLPRRIELCEKALSLISKEKDPKLWGMLQDDLASSLAQTPKGRRAENIESAIKHHQLALEVRPRAQHPREWASTLNNLATAYRDRILGERTKNIEKAIELYQQALEVRTRQADPEHWALTQNNLAGAYYKRICENRAENLELAIRYAQEVADEQVRRSCPRYWAQAQVTLGEAYRVRIRGSRRENIELAIQHFNEALQVLTCHDFPEDWAMIQNDLGNAYLARIEGGQAENIEQAIHHYQQALEVRTRQVDPERWAKTQYNLGNAYRSRIRGDQAENIEQAIDYFGQSLAVRTRQTFPEDWAQTENNLGNAYLSHLRGEREENIDLAIHHFNEALQVRTRQALPAEWAETQNNLGNACLAQTRGNRVENITKAIDHYRQALEVRTQDTYPEDWAQTLNNLAGAERYRASESIEQSIQHLKESLKVYRRETLPQEWAGTQNNLAIAYTDRIHGERVENIQQAIQYYQQALEVYTKQAFPDHCLKTSRALGNLAFQEHQWELSRNAYETAFDAQDVLMQASFTRAVKQFELEEVQNLPHQSAYASVQLKDYKQAVEVLERGRAQLLRESIERRRHDLEDLRKLGFPGLYERYMRAIGKYETLQNDSSLHKDHPESWIAQMDQALAQVQAAAGAIRTEAGERYPQYRYFLQAMPFDEIQKQAIDHPLVYLSTSSVGGLALVVTSDDVQAISLPGLDHGSLQKQIWRPTDEEIERINKHLNQTGINEQDIQAVSGGYFSMYALWSVAFSRENTSDEIRHRLSTAWQETLDETTRWLWDAVLEKLLSAFMPYAEAVTLIPAGQLSLLPLHAAWTQDTTRPTGRRYALDEINITYAPSAHALWQSRLAAGRPVERLLAVDNPDGSLHFSEDEVQAVMDVFAQVCHLHGSDATLDAVKNEMQKAHVLHFSTHGNAGWQKEEQARLKLAGDGYLTLPEIFSLHLDQVRLAVLSACETGVPSLKLIDEMFGLPAGMMQAGVPGVVGSLWAVSDMSTAMLMARFYDLWRKSGCVPQEALRQAQIWLRDSTTAEKKKFFTHFEKSQKIRMSAGAARAFYSHIGWDAPDARVFESPYYWAAFTYTGI